MLIGRVTGEFNGVMLNLFLSPLPERYESDPMSRMAETTMTVAQMAQKLANNISA